MPTRPSDNVLSSAHNTLPAAHDNTNNTLGRRVAPRHIPRTYPTAIENALVVAAERLQQQPQGDEGEGEAATRRRSLRSPLPEAHALYRQLLLLRAAPPPSQAFQASLAHYWTTDVQWRPDTHYLPNSSSSSTSSSSEGSYWLSAPLQHSKLFQEHLCVPARAHAALGHLTNRVLT